jgi:hypothetical protein
VGPFILVQSQLARSSGITREEGLTSIFRTAVRLFSAMFTPDEMKEFTLRLRTELIPSLADGSIYVGGQPSA